MHINRNDIKGNYSEELVTNISRMVAESGDFLAFVKEYMYDDDPIIVQTR